MTKIGKKIPFNTTERDEMIEVLLDIYLTNPEHLESLMPQVANKLDSRLKKRIPSKRSFGLTEREYSQHVASLRDLLSILREGKLSREDSVTTLEECALLIDNGSLPADIGRDIIHTLVKLATGQSPNSVKKTQTTLIRTGGLAKIVSVLRGVTLNLTWDNHLISIDISPSGIKEHRQIMSFVGLTGDPKDDVAENHNKYLGGT